MRLLLDELCPRGVAEGLRQRGHDVVSLHDTSHRHLRGHRDEDVLNAASEERRAVVTDNVGDFLSIHRQWLARGHPHHGLVLFTNRSFPRHRPDRFVRSMLHALGELLESHPGAGLEATSWLHWLAPVDPPAL